MIKLTPTVTWNKVDLAYSTERVVESVNKKIQSSSSCQNFYQCFCDSLPVMANLTATNDPLTNDFSSFFVEYYNNVIAVSV